MIQSSQAGIAVGTVPCRESDTRFSTSGFFMNQCPPGPQVFHWSHFEFFENLRRYSRINVYHDTGDKLFSVSTTPAKNLSPAINLCHGFSVIAGVVDTGEQFIVGDNDTGDKFIAGDKNKDAMEEGSCQG
jgi:hypothetical protein